MIRYDSDPSQAIPAAEAGQPVITNADYPVCLALD